MSLAASEVRSPKVDIAIGLAAQAWENACLQAGCRLAPAVAVNPIKAQRPGRKSGVYRLEGAGDGGAAVIAKRCLRETATVERKVYERILPRVGVTHLKYYGHFEEPGGECAWLFLEDAGDTKPDAPDRALIARYLARLHAESAALAGETSLPERGASHYFEHLRCSWRLIEESLAELALSDVDRRTLERLRGTIGAVESRWHSLSAAATGAPRTLVHGDLSRKNLRLCRADGDVRLLVLDWETAGWGPPAADLTFVPTRAPRPPKPGKSPKWDGTVPLGLYAACAEGGWNGVEAANLERLARLGTLFRAIAGTRWAAEQLRAGGTMKKLNWYAELLPRTMELAER